MTEEYVRMSDAVRVLTNNGVHFCDLVKMTSEMKALETLKDEPCEDCVSREFMYELGAKCIAARDKNGELVAITSIESLPPVAPKPCKDVLDEIKVEFEKLDGMYVLRDYVFYTEKDPKHTELWYVRLKDILDILNKYKEGDSE